MNLCRVNKELVFDKSMEIIQRLDLSRHSKTYNVRLKYHHSHPHSRAISLKHQPVFAALVPSPCFSKKSNDAWNPAVALL